MSTVNIPLSWERHPDANRYAEHYVSPIKMPNVTGNTIDGSYGVLKLTGTVRGDSREYWGYVRVKAYMEQGWYPFTSEANDIGQGNKYYRGKTYSVRVDLSNIPFSAYPDGYQIQLEDLQEMFKVGSCVIDGYLPLNITNVKVEEVSKISHTGQYIYDDFIVNFSKLSSNLVDFQVIQNNKVIIDKQSQNIKSIKIPHGILANTSNVTVKIRTVLKFFGLTYYGNWVNYSINSIKPIEAEKPSNLRQIGEQKSIEEDILFKWETLDNRNSSTIEVWQAGELVTSKTGITSKEYVLKGGTLKSVSDITVKVKNTISVNGYTHTSQFTEIKVGGLVSLKPVIKDFNLLSSNRDYDIALSIDCVSADTYVLFYDGLEIARGNTLTIAMGTLRKGNATLTLKAFKGTSSGLVESSMTKDFSITQDEPIVYAVEPSNIDVNIEEVSTISYSTNKFVNYSDIYINEILFKRGFTGNSFSVGANYFNKGTNSIKVISYYSPPYNIQEVRAYEKRTTFNGYGSPNLPVHDKTTVYNTSTPTFTWTTGVGDSEEQAAYEIEVNNRNVVVNSRETRYTLDEPLSNNNTYKIKLRIKNKYDLWSSFSVKEFYTSFNEIARPTIAVSSQLENVLIQISCRFDPNITKCSVFRSLDLDNWVEIANNVSSNDTLIDYLAKPNATTYYKARVYDTSGSYSDSNTAHVVSTVKNYNLLNLKQLKSNKRLDFASISFTNNFQSVTKIFSDSFKPVFYKGTSSFYTANMVVKLENNEFDEFIDYINNGEIFCYRDYRGKKIFVSIDIVGINYINAFMQEVSLNLTEVNFNEKLSMNVTDRKGFVFLDGQYFLDGTLDLSGELSI